MRKLLSIIVILIVIASPFSLNSVAATQAPSLVITEVMPNPIGSDSIYEWIEIKNLSGQNQLLSEWKINDSILPEVNLTAGEIIVLARNIVEAKNYFSISSQIAQLNLSLSNSGGTIKLLNTINGNLHEFSYSEASEGKSFELLTGNCQTIQINPNNHSAGRPNNNCLETTPSPEITPTPALTNPQLIISTLNYNKINNALELILINVSGRNISNSDLNLTADNGLNFDAHLNDLAEKDKQEYLISLKEEDFPAFIKLYVNGVYQDSALVSSLAENPRNNNTSRIAPEFYPLIR